jgi:hypothetical protein
MQNVFSFMFSKMSEDAFQTILDQSLCATYTIALFCNHALEHFRPISCALVINAWCLSAGAVEGASQRLYDLLLTPPIGSSLFNLLFHINEKELQGQCSYEFMLVLLSRMLMLCSLSDSLYFDDIWRISVDVPISDTSLRLMADNELVCDTRSNTMTVASLIYDGDTTRDEPGRHPSVHADFGCFVEKPVCSIRTLLCSLSYAAIISNHTKVGAVVAYLLQRYDVFLYLRDATSVTAEKGRSIVEFCFNVPTVVDLAVYMEDPMIMEIEKELHRDRGDLTCVEAVSIVARHLT